MEAVPRLPMLSFETRTATEIVSFGQKLKPYIASFYNEDPESYNNEFHSLDTLRAGAVRPSIDVNGCQMLKKYYCQLHFLKSRFPMHDNEVCSINFAWRDCYSRMVCSVTEVDFELMCILYNVGSVHSLLGAQDGRVNPEGMKMACTHFQCAAWAFQNVKENYVHLVNMVIVPEILQFMYLACLAQAQECILEKSMMDNRKATIIAKVAVQVVDYYKQASTTLKSAVDDRGFVEMLTNSVCKDWHKYLNFKIAYHKSIALLYQGQQAEEQQKMGERVAFYQAASDQLNEACKLASKLNHNQQEIHEALAFTGDVVEGKKKAAKNENEFIYHEEVPEKDALQEVKGASLVKGIAFSINDVEVSGPDIFARLVPMEAHEFSSLYSEEKAQILRDMGELLEIHDGQLVEFMSSLQLDVLTQMRQATGLTQDLVDRAAAMSAKPTAIQDLVEAMASLSNTYHDVEAMLVEIDAYLKEEEKKEQEYQIQMGKRPPSILATDLTREYTKYKEAHSKASDSNENLHRAMTTHIANLKVLALPLAQLQQQIPSIEFPNIEIDEDVLRELETLVAKVEEMKGQRIMLCTQLRETLMNDDITELVITKDPNKTIQQLFKEEISKHRNQAALIEQNLDAQENIFKALVDTYARSASTRRYLQDVITKRATTLSALINSFDTYDDLLAKVNKGIEFYTKLETNVTKLLQRIKSTCNVQDEEREQLVSKQNKPKSVEVSTGPKLKDFLDKGKSRKTLDSGGISSTSNVSEQIWPPAVRPAPVGSEMTKDAVGPSYAEQVSYSNYAYDANPGQVHYNPTAFTTAASSLPNTSTTFTSGFNNYMYVQQQYPENSNEQALSDRMAALMLNRQMQEVPQENITNQAYGYAGNYSNQQVLPIHNVYYPAEPFINKDVATSQYVNTPTTVSNISGVQTPAMYAADNYTYQMGGYINTSMPQISSAYAYVSNNSQMMNENSAIYQTSTVQTPSYGYAQMGIQSPNSYSQANSNIYMQTVAASYNFGQGISGAGNAENIEQSVYNYGQSNTQSIQSPYSYTQASNDSNTQSMPSSSDSYAPSTSVQASQEYYDPSQINTDMYSAYNNYMGQYVDNQQSYNSPYGAVIVAGSTSNQLQNYSTPMHVSQSPLPNTVVESKKEKSNIDLLSGLDFTINQIPLTPQQNKADSAPKESCPSAPKPVIEQPTVTTTTATIISPSVNEYISDKKLLHFHKEELQNPANLKLLEQEVERYEKFVDILNTKTLNGPTNLDLKWKEIQDKLELDHQKSISVARCYPMKNRFPDILPYDQTRVKLSSMKDDYINASVFKDVTVNSPTYIVTQAPLQATFVDFWTLVWEQHIELILCLLNDSEMGSNVYWPQENQPLSYRRFSVSLQSINVSDNWTDRIICINHLEQRTSHIVRHLQFTAWPGSIFPTSPVPIIKYINEVLKEVKPLCRPVLVHCLAGIGRSGLFCFLLSAIIEVLVNPTVLPDLLSVAVNLSNIRKNVIRDREHLKLAYQAFLCFLKELCAAWKCKQPLQTTSSVEATPLPINISDVERDPLNLLDPLWASKRKV